MAATEAAPNCCLYYKVNGPKSQVLVDQVNEVNKACQLVHHRTMIMLVDINRVEPADRPAWLVDTPMLGMIEHDRKIHVYPYLDAAAWLRAAQQQLALGPPPSPTPSGSYASLTAAAATTKISSPSITDPSPFGAATVPARPPSRQSPHHKQASPPPPPASPLSAPPSISQADLARAAHQLNNSPRFTDMDTPLVSSREPLVHDTTDPSAPSPPKRRGRKHTPAAPSMDDGGGRLLE
jgi:hypothetical protein